MRVPELRQRLLALRQDLYHRYTYDDEGVKLLTDPSTTVVPLPVPAEWLGKKNYGAWEGPEKTRYSSGIHLTMTRTRPSKMAMSHFALSKYNAMAKLCGTLGDRAFTAREIRETEGETSRTHRLDGKTTPVAAQGEYITKLGQQVSQSIKATLEFHDHEMDQTAADRLLTKRGLDGDSMVCGMVALRSQEKLSRLTWTVNLTNESSREISFAVKLSSLLPTGPLGELLGELATQLESQRAQSERNRLEVERDVEFWSLRVAG